MSFARGMHGVPSFHGRPDAVQVFPIRMWYTLPLPPPTVDSSFGFMYAVLVAFLLLEHLLCTYIHDVFG